MRSVLLGALRIGFAAWVVLARSQAAADEVETPCSKALSAGKAWEGVGKLVHARESFEGCAVATCETRDECKARRNAVDAVLPRVVLSAVDVDGRDYADVEVLIDEWGHLTHLDGYAMPLDPGLHRFYFVGPDGRTGQQTVNLAPGDTNVLVRVVLTGAPASPVLHRPTLRPGPATAIQFSLLGLGAGLLLTSIFGVAADGGPGWAVPMALGLGMAVGATAWIVSGTF